MLKATSSTRTTECIFFIMNLKSFGQWSKIIYFGAVISKLNLYTGHYLKIHLCWKTASEDAQRLRQELVDFTSPPRDGVAQQHSDLNRTIQNPSEVFSPVLVMADKWRRID